jgi:hypothetical protein
MGIAAPTAYQLKAIFIKRFVQFVKWPSRKLESGDSPFVILIIGDSPIKKAFESLGIDSLQNRKVILKRIFMLDENIKNSHIVFISASESYRLKEILSLLKGADVLTIGGFQGFAKSGGGVNLILVNNKIRFEVNKEKVVEGGISISSRVLRLAKTVY